MHRGPILCIVHQRSSYPGRLGQLFMARGFHLDIRCPGVGHALPETPDDYAATLMFGGPMSANDEHLPAIAAELRWLERAIRRPTPFVGVCLGAQILARVLGAKVWLHPEEHVEVGYTGIRPTQDGCDHFDGPMQVFQWHKEGFDLPEGSVLLATGSDSFPNQCFRHEAHCFGLQFHPEVTYEMMQRWSNPTSPTMQKPGAMPREEQLKLHPTVDPPFAQWTERLVDHVIQLSEQAGACQKSAAA